MKLQKKTFKHTTIIIAENESMANNRLHQQ